jgi:hypothetical protein
MIIPHILTLENTVIYIDTVYYTAEIYSAKVTEKGEGGEGRAELQGKGQINGSKKGRAQERNRKGGMGRGNSEIYPTIQTSFHI